MISFWRNLLNPSHSHDDGVKLARALGVRVGQNCRIYDCSFGSEPFLIAIGDHVTVSKGVQLVTHDGGVWVFRDEFPDIDVFAPIRIGNNVFIGTCSVILPGVTIGDNCVIGAGSIVTKDIPSNSVAVGVPAKVVRSLAEYRAKVMQKAVHIRSRPIEEKRRILCEKFSLT